MDTQVTLGKPFVFVIDGQTRIGKYQQCSQCDIPIYLNSYPWNSHPSLCLDLPSTQAKVVSGTGVFFPRCIYCAKESK